MARFWQQRGYRRGLYEKLVGTSLVSDIASGSRADPPLAKAEPIGDGGSASRITDLRRGEKNLHNFSCRKE